MTLKKPNHKILSIWRIRLLGMSVIPSFFTAYFSAWAFHWVWKVWTVLWVGGFLYLYIFYYPIKYKKLSYTFNSRCFILNCGVIYTRVKALPLQNIQYAAVISTPLERLFGLRSLAVMCAGASVYVPGLDAQDALQLQDILTPGRFSGGDPL